MKRFLKTGKKALSVFMAVIMVMTAWVFVAPEKAEAATAGSYYFRITYSVGNKEDHDKGEFTGSNGESKDGMVITYTNQDGTTGTYIISLCGGTSSDGKKTCNRDVFSVGDDKTCTGRLSGAPTKIRLYIYGSSTDAVKWYITKIELASNSAMTENRFDLWTGEVGCYTNHLNGASKNYTIDFTKSTGQLTEADDANPAFTTMSTLNYKGTPAVATVSSFSLSPTTQTIPTGTTANTVTATMGVLKDQYGVNWYQDPYVAVSGRTGVTASDRTTISVASTAMHTASPWYTDCTVTVRAGSTSGTQVTLNGTTTNSWTLRVINPQYTYTLNGNGGSVTSPSTTTVPKYYNETFGYVPNATRTGFAFKEFYTTDFDDSYETVNYSGTALSSSTVTKGDTTWYAAWQANAHDIWFKYRDSSTAEWIQTAHTSTYYGRTITFPTLASTITTEDYIYTLNNPKWNPNHTTVPNNNQEYVAQYTITTRYADYTTLDNLISQANTIRVAQRYIDGGYTESSLTAFDAAYSNAVGISRTLLRSQQAQVDIIADALQLAIYNLTPKMYTVLFVTEDGSIVKYDYVGYGDSVTVPATPVKEPDADSHYTFTGWDNTDSDDISECNFVKDDLKFIVKFSKAAHNFTTTTTPSTCTSDGVITKTCSNANCGYSYSVANESDLASHAWSTDYRTICTAACGKTGKEAKYCTRCDVYDPTSIRDIAALSHNWGTEQIVRAATCESIGLKKKVCSRCNNEAYTIIEKNAHALSEWVTINPDCYNGGYTKRTCSNCDYIETKDSTAALGHNEVEVERVNATCVNSGYIKTNCNRCNDYEKVQILNPTTVHTYPTEWTVLQDSDCVSTGIKIKLCTVCGGAMQTEVISELKAHSYGAWATILAPTCEGKGVEGKTCGVCGKVVTQEISATGHNYQDLETIAPTCLNAGYTKEKCQNCNDIRIKDGSITDPTGHSEILFEDVPATCTTDGHTTYKCNNTPCDYSRTVIVPKTGHDPQRTAQAAATCTVPGFDTYTCQNGCGFVYYEFTDSATGHQWTDWTVVKEATNEEDGTEMRTCTVPECASANIAEYRIIPKFGHEWNAGKVTLEPTCTETGIKLFTCTRTGSCSCSEGSEATYEQIIPALGHDFVENTAPATCAEPGKITYKCSRCSEEAFPEVTLQTIDHVWDEGTETTKATCTTNGKKTYYCTNCDIGVKIIEIPMLGHYTGEEYTQATCVTGAYTTYKCLRENCDYSFIIPDPDPDKQKKGHDFENGTIVEHKDPSCEEYGYTIKKCSRCEETNTTTTSPIGHDWGDWVVEIEPTCGGEGIRTSTCRNNSNHKKTEKFTYEDPIPHVFTKVIVAPTCTQDGFTMYSCKNCEYVYRDEFVDALGHDMDEGVYSPATCLDEGGTYYTCRREGCTHKVFKKDADALGHEMGEYVYVAYPGDSNAYAKERKCVRTGCTFTEYEKGTLGINKYYFVEFINDKVTDTYEDPAPDKTEDFKGTLLAKTYKPPVVLQSMYVLKGTEAVYTGKTPVRDKDINYGIYEFTGWKLDDESASLSNVTQNIKATAQFVGGDMYYNVVFQNPINGKHYTAEYTVLHGHPITYDQAEPASFTNNHYRYIFDHWDRDLSHIYSSGGINAIFNIVPDETTVVYHDWNGTRISSEVVQYHQPAQNAPTGLTRAADSTYIYEFSGKWTLANGKEFDINCAEFENGTQSVDVYAKYYQKFIDYKVTIQVFDADANLVARAPVQILDSKGQLAYAGYTNEEGMFMLNVKYDTSYTAQVSDSNGGAVQATFTVPRNTPVKLQYKDNTNYDGSECKCICHSFLGGLWITCLNILYKLFKLKHVCCYDMYATHGDRLVYTQ